LQIIDPYFNTFDSETTHTYMVQDFQTNWRTWWLSSLAHFLKLSIWNKGLLISVGKLAARNRVSNAVSIHMVFFFYVLVTTLTANLM